MKILNKITLLLLTVLIVNCGSDDNDNSPSNTNKFTVQNVDYETPNAYLLLDDGPSFTNAFGFVFLNGTMREDNVNGASLSINTTQGVNLFVRLGSNPVTSEQAITNVITNGANFSLDADARVITNLSNFTDTYTYNGVQYGDSDNTGANVYEINNTGSGSVTVNSFTVDLTARTGTVDCTYTITDENGITITGNYNGNFEIINEF